ncbi:hypothetical protein D1N44_04630, partial [Clostridioides difficile]
IYNSSTYSFLAYFAIYFIFFINLSNFISFLFLLIFLINTKFFCKYIAFFTLFLYNIYVQIILEVLSNE